MSMSTEKVQLSIANEFSRTPGPRKESEGNFSGEVFLKLLRERFVEAQTKGTKLLVDLDGAAGYPTSFLEAAFGGLAREKGPDTVLETLEFKCEDEPDLENEIREYIREALR